MISKISRLKKFGIFHDFSWNSKLPEFDKFNLIYGWNRSGKTTLSRVFASCEKRCVYDKEKFKEYPENGEFTLKTNDGTTVAHTNVAKSDLPVRVFNKDFIDENISFDPKDPCNPIVYVSGQDIASKRKLDQLKTDIVKLNKSHEQARKNKSAKEKIKTVFLQGLGREVSNAVFDKSYNRTKVEQKINEIGVDNFSDKILQDESLIQYNDISKGTELKEQAPLSNYSLSISFEGQAMNSFQEIFEEVQNLLKRQVVSETLDRLKQDSAINDWVKRGFDLHKKKNENEKCLFCQKPLDHHFLNTLSNHFSEDYAKLQASVDQLKNEVLELKRTSIADQNNDLYPFLKNKYSKKATELNSCIKKIDTWVNEAVEKLNEKHLNPLETTTSPSMPEEFGISYDKIIGELNKIISAHNSKVRGHANEVSKARKKIELHTIAKALADQNYKQIVADLEKASNNETKALKSVTESNSKIAELENRVSNISGAIDKINQYLRESFGRDEIKLVLDAAKQGYKIERNGQLAKNLSEGEKTAIAFSYFVAKVEENSFDKSKGIIFIDDPISSFDSNFIYHCFSMISTHFNSDKIGQLFISTHNFQLFNLVKRWLAGKKHCEFFMVENYTEADERKAKIVELDRTLRDYESEYQFLFVKLKEFSEKQDTEYKDFYTIGNMARRFLDIFVDFKIPYKGDQRSKLNDLIKGINNKGEKISAVNTNKVYLLMNALSHNSDPTSTIEHKDKQECKDAIEILLKIVEESDPTHFEILDKEYIRTRYP